MVKVEFIDGKTRLANPTNTTQYDDALNFIDPLADTYRFKGFPVVELTGKIAPPIRTENSYTEANGSISKSISTYTYEKNKAGFLTKVIVLSSGSKNGVITSTSSVTALYTYTGCR